MRSLFQKNFLSITRAVLGTAFLFLGLLLVSSPASASTSKSGTISANETWDVAGSPYIITNWTYINSGVTVAIDPGVTVKVQAGGIIVTGTLDANGTSGSPVFITSYYDDAADGQNTDGTGTPPAAGQWQYLKFESGSVGDFEYTTIRYGGYSCFFCAAHKMVWNVGGTITFDESNLTNAQNYALHQETSGSVTMVGGMIDNNPLGVLYAVGTMSFDDVEIKDLVDARATATSLSITDSYINTGSVDSYTSFTFTGNTLAGATINIKKLTSFTHSGNTASSGVKGYYLSGLTSGNTTLAAESGMAYIISDGFDVQSGHTLTIDAGAVVKFPATSSSILGVSGTLEVDGTSMAPVYFSSIKDDSTGSDTNGDSTSTSPAAGDWHGIQFESGSVGNFSYAIMKYGGKACVPCLNKEKMVWNKGGTLTLEDSQILNSYRYGLYQETSGSTSMIDGVVDNNAEGIYLKHGTMSFTDDVDIKDLIDAQSTGTSLTVTDSNLNTGSIYSSVPFTFTGNTLTSAIVRIKRLSYFLHSGNTVSSGTRGYYLDGQTSGDSILTAESGLVYLLDAPFYIVSGHTMTIEEDAIFKFLDTSSGFMSIAGTVEAKGTGTDPIYFTSYKDDAAGGDTNNDSTATSPAAGNWYGIEVTSGGVGNFAGTVFRYGGKWCSSCQIREKMIQNTNGVLNFYNASLTDSLNYAIHQTGAGSSTMMSDGFVDANDDGIYYSDGTMSFMDDVEIKDLINASTGADSLSIVDSYMNTAKITTYAPFTFTGNELYNAEVIIANLTTFIHEGNTITSGVAAYTLAGQTGSDAVLRPESGIVYLVDGDFSVLNTHTLNIEAGTIIKFKQTAGWLPVNNGGELRVNGTAANPVYFTSYKDDSVGGDTNNNSTANSAAAGDWGKINFASGSAGSITHAVIRYGGYNGTSSQQYMVFNDGGAITITDSDLVSSQRYGFYQASGTSAILASALSNEIIGAYITGGTVDIVGSQIQSNSQTGLFATGGTITISGSTISGNTSYGVYSSSPSIDAEGNYWGHSSGPYHASTNPTATGNAVSDGIDYTPWETSLETTAPTFAITLPSDGVWRVSSVGDVEGTVTDGGSGVALVKVNGFDCVVDSGDWLCSDVPVQPGANVVAASAWDYAGNRADDSITINRRVPVIFIPGIAGSHLYDGNLSDQTWLDVDQIIADIGDEFLTGSLSLDIYGEPYNSIFPIDVIREVEVADAPVFEIYEGLIDEFIGSDYIETGSLFLFPYDWRLDLRDTADELSEEINDILEQTNSDQVDLVTHSMGGLLAKQYIREYGTENIRKTVFVGTPHLGSPYAAEALMFGTDFGINRYIDDVPLTTARIKELALNMPTVYELNPSRTYLNKITPYLTLIAPPANPSLDYEESKNYLYVMRSLNDYLLDEMVEFHDQKLEYLDFRQVEAYNITGCNSSTAGAFAFNEYGEVSLIGWLGGDQTVPYQSADFGAIPTQRKYYLHDYTLEHGVMMSRTDISEAIVEILTDSGTSAREELDDNTAYCGATGDSFVWMSPVDVHVYDSEGRHTGLDEKGNIQQQIPGVAYKIIGHHKFLFLPADEKNYSVVAIGTDNGTFDLRHSVYLEDQVMETEVFNDVPVKIQTRVEFERKNNRVDESIKVTDPGATSKMYHPFTKELPVGEEWDLTKPETSVSVNDAYLGPNVLELKSSDIDSGVAAIYYSVDGTPYIEYSGAIKLEGIRKHKIVYYAVDHAGNNEDPKEYIWDLKPIQSIETK